MNWNYNVHEIPNNTKNLHVLFDNGSQCLYESKNWPFAEVIAWAFKD